MKRPDKGVSLLPVNYNTLVDQRAKNKLTPAMWDLLAVIAEVCDQAVTGEDIFLTVGMPKNKSSLLVTVTWDRNPTWLSGATLEECASQAHKLLD